MMNLRSKKSASMMVPSAIALVLVMSLILALGSCENPEGALKPNSPPDTRIANVPANDTIAQYLSLGAIPQQTLFWAGDDPDGYIIAFRYTWTDSSRGVSTPTDTVTLVNLATVGGIVLDTLAVIPETTRRNRGATFRIYNFLATLDPNNLALQGRIADSLSTLRPFAVPYSSGFVPGDSLRGADPLFNETPTKGIFIFNSPADSNVHRFEVWAIDNLESIDPTPATVHFWTLPSPGLTVSISGGPTTSSTAYVLRYPTERSPGLLFTFAAVDPSTNERDYSWTVDDTVTWSAWDAQALATVTASDFQETGSDTHTFYLRGRNKWGVISPIASRQFTAAVPPIDDPAWPPKTLIINNCRINSPPTPTWMPPVDSAEVNAFYREVMESIGKSFGPDFDIYVTSSNSNRFPAREVLGQYTSVLLLSEQELPNSGLGVFNRIDAVKYALLVEYLNIGGKLIFSGSPNIRLVFGLETNSPWWYYDASPTDNTPAVSIADQVFHVRTLLTDPLFPFVQNGDFDFVGAKGILGYPDIQVDTTKLPAVAMSAMANISVNYPRGFGQSIFEFDSRGPNPIFEGAPLGIRYLAPPAAPPARETYSVVYFGFPLYYMEKSDVIEVLRKAFEDIGE